MNAAERRADWWLYGGIYRPVYLKAMPKTHIERIAVNAMANGKLATELHLKNISQDYSVAATITPVGSKTSIGRQIISLNSDEIQTITTEWKGIQTWDCENPNLYTLKLELLNPQKQIVHIHEERIDSVPLSSAPRTAFMSMEPKL